MGTGYIAARCVPRTPPIRAELYLNDYNIEGENAERRDVQPRAVAARPGRADQRRGL